MSLLCACHPERTGILHTHNLATSCCRYLATALPAVPWLADPEDAESKCSDLDCTPVSTYSREQGACEGMMAHAFADFPLCCCLELFHKSGPEQEKSM